MADEFFLSRWSRLKRESRETPARAEERHETPSGAPGPATVDPVAGSAPARRADAPAEPPPLPPVESLTPESDFSPFMREDVDPNLRQQALRTLFNDPRFNVMDGLDVYIDDYSKPDPLPPEWLAKLNQATRLGEYREPDPESPEGVAARAATGADSTASPMESDTSDAGISAPEVGDQPLPAGVGDEVCGVHSTAKETYEFRPLSGPDQTEERTRDVTRGGRRHE